MNILNSSILIVFLNVAMFMDILTGKIKNWWIMVGFTVGLCVQLYENHKIGLLYFLSCIAVLFICPSLFIAIEHPIQFKQFSTFNNFPIDDVHQVFQSCDGFLCFSSRMVFF